MSKITDFQRYYLQQHPGLIQPAAPEDTAYDLYLKKTLGRILPQVVQGCLDARPRDPITWLSVNLRMCAGDQNYIKKVLAFQKNLRAESRNLTTDKMKTKSHLNSMRSQLILDDISRKDARKSEKEDLKWCMDNRDKLMEMCRAQCNLVPDDITWEAPDLKECSKECFSKVMKDIKGRISTIKKEERKEERERLEKEKLEKRQTIPNLIFRRMALRMIEAHKKERLKYDRENPEEAKKALESHKSSQKDSGKSSRHTEHKGESGDDLYEEGTVKEVKIAESLPTLPASLRDSFLDALAARPSFDGDIEQLRLHRDAKVKALRALQHAMLRGDYTDLDEDEKVLVYASPSFQAIGLVPPYKLCKLRKLLFEAPSVWEAEGYDCSVFYEPELYIRCPGELDEHGSVKTSVEMGPEDYAKPAAPGRHSDNSSTSRHTGKRKYP